MRTFLITWNPKAWRWDNLSRQAVAIQNGEIIKDQWSCGNRKDIEPGDRLFLLKQGAEPRGIIASGWAISKVFRASHWDAHRASMGHETNYVRLRFDRLTDPDVGDVLPRSSLDAGKMAHVNWEYSVIRHHHRGWRGRGSRGSVGEASGRRS